MNRFCSYCGKPYVYCQIEGECVCTTVYKEDFEDEDLEGAQREEKVDLDEKVLRLVKEVKEEKRKK